MKEAKISKSLARREALRFLKAASTATVATSFNDKPYASIVYFAVDNKLNFYFFTKRRTNKYLNLAVNTAVAIAIGSDRDVMSVQANGTAHILYKKEKDKTINRIKKEIFTKGRKIVPIEELTKFNKKEDIVASSYVVFKMVPKEIFYFNLNGKDYSRSRSKEYIRIFP